MANKITIPILALLLIPLAACDSGPVEVETKKEHVWKEQTGAIDKAREVETILQGKKNQENQ